MSIVGKSGIRLTLVFVMVLAIAVLTNSYAAASVQGVGQIDAGSVHEVGDDAGWSAAGPPGAPAGSASVDVYDRFAVAAHTELPGESWNGSRVTAASAEAGNVTVVANQGFASVKPGALIAFLPNGTVIYYDETYEMYFDVDPVAGERYTVEYVTAERLSGQDCEGLRGSDCTRNLVRRVNLTSGDEETIYAERTHRSNPSMRWHDVDRWNESTIVVADIIDDGVFAVDTRDGSVVWEWAASENYDRGQGGARGDWTHINDVEVLPGGRVMVSVRNMDSVVFVEVDGGEAVMNESWTLGADDDLDVLYEQHNPDYIPAAQGGPAVVVADSETGRIVEYQRVGGEWRESWSWRDVRLQWPRDADRLPNGNTLVADSHGNRVVEVAPGGEVVWSADVGMAYDVERLGSGDESANGPSMTQIREMARGGSGPFDPAGFAPSSRSAPDAFWIGLKNVAPSLLVNGILYVSPPWVGFTDLAFMWLILVTAGAWGILELRWSGYELGTQIRHRIARLRGRIRPRIARLRGRVRSLQHRLTEP